MAHSLRRVFFAIFLCFILCGTHASAQSPVPTATGRVIDVSLGYSYISHQDSLSNRVGLSGADASFTMGINPRLAVRADLGYARAANVLGSGRHSDVLSYVAGPVFYLTTHRHFVIYLHGLVGAARVTGPVFINGGGLPAGGFANEFAWAAGGGAEYWITDSMAIRTGADYLRTEYFDPSQAIRGQNNIRTTVSMVFFLGKVSRGRR
jgi:opacity protein-like surface antigen